MAEVVKEGRSLRIKAPNADASSSEEVVKSDGQGKTVRVQMLLPPQSVARLESLRKMTEASSSSEVIRNAIRIYEALVKKEVRDKASIFIKAPDGTMEQIRIF